MKAELISQSEYARRRGVRPSAVARAVKAGRISLIDGKVDPDVADVQWAANSRVRSGSRPSSHHDSATVTAPVAAEAGYHASRARREAAEAALSELRLAEQSGAMVSMNAVRAAMAPRLIAARGLLLSLGARLAPVLAAESDQTRCHDLLDAELRRALATLAGALDDLPAAPGEVRLRGEAQP